MAGTQVLIIGRHFPIDVNKRHKNKPLMVASPGRQGSSAPGRPCDATPRPTRSCQRGVEYSCPPPSLLLIRLHRRLFVFHHKSLRSQNGTSILASWPWINCLSFHVCLHEARCLCLLLSLLLGRFHRRLFVRHHKSLSSQNGTSILAPWPWINRPPHDYLVSPCTW